MVSFVRVQAKTSLRFQLQHTSTNKILLKSCQFIRQIQIYKQEKENACLNCKLYFIEYNYSSEFKMQKRNYQEFRDEQETELPNYHASIPVGQPVNPNAYPQAPLQHPPQYIPQQQQFVQQQMAPTFALPPPPPFPMPQVAPPQVAHNFNYPVQLQCPCCKMTVPTVVNQESGNTTYLWCGFLFFCVSPLCCCLPFLMDSCLDKTHYCPNCGHAILRKHQKCFEFIGC